MNLKKFFRNLLDKDSHEGVQCDEYAFVERVQGEDVIQGIAVKSGKYSGLIFAVTSQVKFINQTDGTIKMHFEYEVLRNPNWMSPEDSSKQQFEKTVGDIIVDIISRSYATGTTNPISTSERPGVFEESTTSPEI